MGVENFAEVLHRKIFRHGNVSPLSNCDKRPTDSRTHNRFDELATSYRAPKGLGQGILQVELGDRERQLISALGHVWTAPWQELSDAAAALVGCGHVSGLFVRRSSRWP